MNPLRIPTDATPYLNEMVIYFYLHAALSLTFMTFVLLTLYMTAIDIYNLVYITINAFETYLCFCIYSYSLFGFGMLMTQLLQRTAVFILKPNVNKLLYQIFFKYTSLSFTGSVVCVVASPVFIR